MHKEAGWKTPVWDVYKGILAEAEDKPVELVEVRPLREGERERG